MPRESYNGVQSLAVAAAGVAAVLVAAFALLTPGEKAATLGLTRHGELVVAVDGGAADVVGLVGVTPGTPAQVLTVSDAGVPHWAAAAGGGGGSTDPVEALPEPDSVVLYLRNADLRGQDGTFASMWRAAAGPPGFGMLSRVTGTTDALWYGGALAGFPIFQTTSGVRELRWQGSVPGAAPLTPGTGSASWSVMAVVVGAQLTGTAAAILGWGNFPNGQNVCLFSRWNSKTAWGATVRSNSGTDETQIILDDSGFPATTDPTALLLTYDGTTLSLWKAVSGDASWVSVGTLTVTLNLSAAYPLGFSRAGGGVTFASTVGFREAVVWRAAIDSDARTALRTYVTTAGLL